MRLRKVSQNTKKKSNNNLLFFLNSYAYYFHILVPNVNKLTEEATRKKNRKDLGENEIDEKIGLFIVIDFTLLR